jgi:hypothetical protein
VRAGDTVELRPPGEILATLDEQGCLEGVPFMPEMLGYFGKTFVVKARVERACDTVAYSGVLRLKDTVILDELRCDGTAHGGCGAQCRLYWKEAWLRPSSASASGRSEAAGRADLERLVAAGVQRPGPEGEQIFRCQATELVRAGEPVGWYRIGRELSSGNVGLWRFVRGATGMVFQEVGRRLGLRRERPFRSTKHGKGSSVAVAPQGLLVGQLVQIRSRHEIRETLGENGKNRGLWFDREMVPYCGQTAHVKARVERFIDEGSGRLVELASDCYILDDVVCRAEHSTNRWFCPRAIYPWWREAWLRPVATEHPDSPTDAGDDRTRAQAPTDGAG